MVNKYLNKLQGRRVLVVGGTSGIGLAVAEASVEHGANVVVASRSQENVDQAVALIRQEYPDAGDRIRGHTLNLSADDLEQQLTMVLDFATNNGTEKLDHVVDTAGESDGVGRLPGVADASQEVLSQIMKTRVVGVAMLARYSMQYLKPEYTSSFTMTGGANTYRPNEGWGLMAGVGGTKDGFSRGLAQDMKPIRVNLVSPGAIDTPLLRAVGDRVGGVEKMKEMFGKMALLNRVGTAEDTAEIYLAIMKSHFITAEVVHVEGGFRIAR